MSDMISTMQQELLDWFPDEAAGGYPKVVKPYGGQLRNPNEIYNLPAVLVDVPPQFRITSPDAMFELLDMEGSPQLVLFDKNEASAADNRAAIAKLIDWCVDQMQGQSITINGNVLPLERIDGNIITDYADDIAAATLTLEFTSFQ